MVDHAGQGGSRGPGAERAVPAFAKASGDLLEYEVSPGLELVERIEA